VACGKAHREEIICVLGSSVYCEEEKKKKVIHWFGKAASISGPEKKGKKTEGGKGSLGWFSLSTAKGKK